jgi:hypothetical protein
MTDSAPATNAFATPAWWNRCRQALVSGSTKAIILHLNTRDYAVPGKHLTTYLCKLLANRDVVAIYNRATGITFPLETMEQRARDLLGMNRAQGASRAPRAPHLPHWACQAEIKGASSSGPGSRLRRCRCSNA